MKHNNTLSRNISSVTTQLETVITTETFSRINGLLQNLDPRVKLVSLLAFIVTAGFTHSVVVLSAMVPVVAVLGLLSGIKQSYLFKRILLFVPLFTAVVAIPALFITPGTPLLSTAGHTVVTVQGARTAALLLLRVTDSLSFSILLVLTTPWAELLATFRWFRVPSLFVSVVAMTYRYIFVLLHTVNSMFLARRSRSPGILSAKENRRWLGRTLAATMIKSYYLSEQVYMAMLSRGYRDHSLVITHFKLRHIDLYWAMFSTLAVTVLIKAGQ